MNESACDINKLARAEWAERERDALRCQLTIYLPCGENEGLL